MRGFSSRLGCKNSNSEFLRASAKFKLTPLLSSAHIQMTNDKRQTTNRQTNILIYIDICKLYTLKNNK